MLYLPVVLSALVWVWLLLLHGRFWRSGPVLEPVLEQMRQLRVTVVIPARDEAEHIAATLQSLLGQEFAGELRVVLVDDDSSDGTGEIARAIAAEDGRLRVIAGGPLAGGGQERCGQWRRGWRRRRLVRRSMCC